MRIDHIKQELAMYADLLDVAIHDKLQPERHTEVVLRRAGQILNQSRREEKRIRIRKHIEDEEVYC